MCRNIRTLHNFEPHATTAEVEAAALQYVRKISGSTKPSKANEEAFNRAVHEIAHATAAPARRPGDPCPGQGPRGGSRQGEGQGCRPLRRGLRASREGTAYLPKLRSRSELATTSTELAAMAAPAIIGLSRPRAATGIPTAL